MDKLPDTEIVKALEWHLNNENNCDECPLLALKNTTTYCVDELLKCSLSLINSLQAKVEYYKKNRNKYQDDVMYLSKQLDNLQAENEMLKALNGRLVVLGDRFRAELKTAKAEAVKEFAEELNNKGMRPNEITDDFAVGLETINKLLEERVGDKKCE
jgi:FtsZ-binding cell division protein ZapB